VIARGWGSAAPAPPGATRSGSAEWQPSEIPSQTRSVSAFLLSGSSTGPRSSGDVRSEPQPRAPRCRGARRLLDPISRRLCQKKPPSTFLSCPFREQEDDQAVLPMFPRPRMREHRKSSGQPLSCPAAGLMTLNLSWTSGVRYRLRWLPSEF